MRFCKIRAGSAAARCFWLTDAVTKLRFAGVRARIKGVHWRSSAVQVFTVQPLLSWRQVTSTCS